MKRIVLYFTILLFITALNSCSTINGNMYYSDDYNIKGNGIDVDINISEITESEYSFLINKLETKYKYNIKKKKYDNKSASFVFQIPSLSHYNILLDDLESIKSIYNQDIGEEDLLKRDAGYLLLVFSRNISAGSVAQYKIEVNFDPNSTVLIGGYETQTNSEGHAVFNGASLDLSEARSGTILILDSWGNSVEAKVKDDGFWYFTVTGNNLGNSVTKEIEMEVLR